MISMDEFIRFIADGLMIIIFCVAIYGFAFKIPRKKWLYWAPRIALVGAVTYGLAKLAAWLYQPEMLRPFEKMGVEPGAAYLNNPGFPSDHALFAMFLVISVWVSTRNRTLAILLLILTIVMGLGRVLALVHTPLDVIGGFAIACVGGLLYRLLIGNVVQYGSRIRRGERNGPSRPHRSNRNN